MTLLVLTVSCNEKEKEKIRASIWFFSVERQEIYRNLNNGDQEFLPFVAPQIEDYVALNKIDFVEFVDTCTGYRINNVNRSKLPNR